MPAIGKKASRREKPLLFVIPGVLMLLAGFGMMLSCSFGPRLDSSQSLLLPFGFATAAVGGMVLTRSLLATFFLFVFSLTVLIISIAQYGITNPINIPALVLIMLCIPQAKHARR